MNDTEVSAVDEESVFAKARKSSLQSQKDLADKLNLSVPSIVKREKHPEEMTLSEASAYYHASLSDGKQWIKDYVMTFFMP